MLARATGRAVARAERMDDRDERIAALRRIELLAGLGEAHLARFAEHCVFQRVAAGQTVIGADDADGSTDAFLVLEGRLGARSRSRDGREIAFLTVETGGLFGEFSAIDGAPRSAEIVAVSPSWIARLSSTRLREVVMVLPVIGLRLCELLVAKNREMSQRLLEFATMSVRQRILATLYRLAADRSGMDRADASGTAAVEHPPTQYEIAITAGTNRETVSREMAALARSGLIEYDRRTLRVNDMAGLRRLAENG